MSTREISTRVAETRVQDFLRSGVRNLMNPFTQDDERLLMRFDAMTFRIDEVTGSVTVLFYWKNQHIHTLETTDAAYPGDDVQLAGIEGFMEVVDGQLKP